MCKGHPPAGSSNPVGTMPPPLSVRMSALIKLITVLLASVLCLSYLFDSKATNVHPGPHKASLVTNEGFINGLYQTLDLEAPTAVFRHVFSQLGDEVTVYPTENYYYFECALRGIPIRGNISLPADSRDGDAVSFSYAEEYPTEDPAHQPLEKEVDLAAHDGVHLRKVSDFKYTISFEGKTVTFKLNDVGLSPPRRVILSPDETFVGPSFDESGLQFHLINNGKCPALFWILNEDKFLPETFTSYTPAILIGRRTEFAFYDDRDHNRKILIGVKKSNVIRNNWYDGPFDQLPDNYIKTGQVQLRKHVEAAYPHAKGKIDQYGIFLSNRDVRLAITSYLEYTSADQLTQLVSSSKTLSKSKSDFYCRLIKAR